MLQKPHGGFPLPGPCPLDLMGDGGLGTTIYCVAVHLYLARPHQTLGISPQIMFKIIPKLHFANWPNVDFSIWQYCGCQEYGGYQTRTLKEWTQ